MADPPARYGGKWTQRHNDLAEKAGFGSWEEWCADIEHKGQKGAWKKICGGMTRKHRPCGLPAGYKTDHVGEGRCSLHGGLAVSGPAHPCWVDGHARRYKPNPKYAEAFEAMVNDPEIQSLNEEIGMARLRIKELFEGLPDGEAIPVELKRYAVTAQGTTAVFLQKMKALAEAAEVKDTKRREKRMLGAMENLVEYFPSVGGSLATLISALEPMIIAAAIWPELWGVQEHLRKLVDTQEKRIQKAYEVVSEPQMALIIEQMKQIVLQVVASEKIPWVQTEFRRVMGITEPAPVTTAQGLVGPGSQGDRGTRKAKKG